MLGGLILRDLLLALRSAAWLPVLFFLIVIVLVPFGIGPDAPLVARIAPGIVWVAALLAALLPVERLVGPDMDGGVIDQLVLRDMSEEGIALAKMVAHWLSFGPFLLLALFPAAALLGLEAASLGRLVLTLLIGTPALAALGVGVAALTTGLPRASALSAVIALPLAVPLLIFGASASQENEGGALAFLAATSLVIVVGTPFAAGAAIRAART